MKPTNGPTILALLLAWDRQAGDWAHARGACVVFLHEFICFGLKQAFVCLFGGGMLLLLGLTWAFYPPHAALARYDFLTLAALAMQCVLMAAGLETREEARVILLFHMVGMAMEVFKTSVGSWVYPEPSLLHIGGVPLFSGFMYASVGSYIARAWRVFDFRFSAHPSWPATAWLALAIYANFFTHHFAPDLRWLLFALVVLLFGRTWVYFRIRHVHRRMPLLLGFLLVAAFIWLAENVGTYTAAWRYPMQHLSWRVVPLSKLGSWFLLMIISYVMVSTVAARQAGGKSR